MKTEQNLLQLGKTTLQLEANSLLSMAERLGESFVKAIKLIDASQGRVVVSGIGKSANIAQKIVATFNSTGTPALFMHAADAIHGDLGNVQKDDVVILLSKSGTTPEIKVLLPLIKNMGNPIIAIVGNSNSALAQQAEVFLDASVEKEACPNNLAPTSSTTAQLAMGDALAVCLLKLKGFTPDDFARYHPGGTLGKRLYLTAGDLLGGKEKPVVSPSDSIEKALFEITEKRLGATAVIENNALVGIITDGDVRRMLGKGFANLPSSVREMMTHSPKHIGKSSLAVEALALMEKHKITQLPIYDEDGYHGIIHLHDLIQEGII